MGSSESPDIAGAETIRAFASGHKLFGRYTLRAILGRGGMGVVWRAHDEQLGRDVALKFLPELMIHDRAVLEDLKSETRRSLELTHHNIVRIYDFVQDAQSACISMEFVDGETLSSLRAAKPKKTFETGELLPLLEQICNALDYAHQKAKIVHRDLKPANLMLTRQEQIKVADFGIARSLSDSMSMLTQSRGTSGTLLYMSPQQMDGMRTSHLDDIYSLGASIYELLSSKPPFYTGDISRQISEKVPPPISTRRAELAIANDRIPDHWEKTIAACLAKNPSARPQSAAEVYAYLKGERAARKKVVPEKVAAASVGSGRRWLIPAVVLILAISGFLTVSLKRNRLSQTNLSPAAQPAPTNPAKASPFPTAPSPTNTNTPSAAEKDFADAMELWAGLNKRPVNMNEVRRLIIQAAQAGLPEAEARLAVWKHTGFDEIQKNEEGAAQLAKTALADGLATRAESRPDAAVALGLLYMANLVPGKVPSDAIEIYQRAADQGYLPAIINLARCYSSGTGIQRDVQKAVELYSQAADKGDVVAQSNLGGLYEKGDVMGKDLAKAIKLYEKASEQGYPTAQVALARLYNLGIGVPKDNRKAAELLEKAAAQRDVTAETNLGYLLMNGIGVTKDAHRAAGFLEEAAAVGEPSAQTSLGWLYQQGDGVPKDLNKALELYRQAADKGNAMAINDLANLYMNGTGVPKDAHRGIELLQRAVDQGSVKAETNLALAYKSGMGVPQDEKKAADLFEKAAEQGDASAQNDLGVAYATGSGRTRSAVKAAELFQKAADQGAAMAQKNLGMAYEKGEGVHKDVKKAMELYRKAAAQGLAEANDRLHRMQQNKQ